MLEDCAKFAVADLAVLGRDVPGRLCAYWVTACSASAVKVRPRVLH